MVGNKKLHSLICSNSAQSCRLVLIFLEPLEGVCKGLRYVFQIPKVFLVGERQVPAKIRTQNIKNLECVRMMNLLRMVLGQKPWHVSLCELSRSPAIVFFFCRVRRVPGRPFRVFREAKSGFSAGGQIGAAGAEK